MAEFRGSVVLTTEQTPLGEFEMNWGTVDPRVTLSSLGIVYGPDDDDALLKAVWCRDPQHDEATAIHLYRDANGKAYALGEITNGVWVVGVAVRDEPASTSILKEELAPSIRSGELFVDRCNGNEISVACRRSDIVRQTLEGRGYSFRPTAHDDPTGHRHLVRTVSDDDAKAAELMALRDLGIPFSGGREWNPTEVFEHLRERCLANGGYWSIWWQGLGRFEIRWND